MKMWSFFTVTNVTNEEYKEIESIYLKTILVHSQRKKNDSNTSFPRSNK